MISIHASAREATLSFGFPPFALLFQSTPPRGRRRHPARQTRLSGRRFQSTPPRGRRPPFRWHSPQTRRFQSTPPRGRRQSAPWMQFDRDLKNFNPRLREGGDDAPNAVLTQIFISIHASAREATYLSDEDKARIIISIHASAREATKSRHGPALLLYISIHASAREATYWDGCEQATD